MRAGSKLESPDSRNKTIKRLTADAQIFEAILKIC